MEPRLDQAAGDVLELLAGLHEEIVARRDLDGDAAARVARPHVQARVARAAVDGEEVEVRVEAGQDGVLFAVLCQVRCGRGEEMGSIIFFFLSVFNSHSHVVYSLRVERWMFRTRIGRRR